MNYDDDDDFYVLELDADAYKKDKASEKENRLRSQTIDTLVSRELKAEQELTGFAKIKSKVNNYAINATVAASTTGLIGYLHDESVAEYAVKGGLISLTVAAAAYCVGKAIGYFKPASPQTDKEKHNQKVKEYGRLIDSQDKYLKLSPKQKVIAVGTVAGVTVIAASVAGGIPFAVLGSLYDIGAGTGFMAMASEVSVASGRVLYSRQQKLEQYDLERARIVGSEKFKR